MPFNDAIRLMLREEVRAAVREELQALRTEWQGAPSTPDDLLSVKDAARVAHVCASTIRTWIHSGSLKRYGTARLPRIRRADLLRFMATQASGATEPHRSIDEHAALILLRQNRPPHRGPSAPVPPSAQAAPARVPHLSDEEPTSNVSPAANLNVGGTEGHGNGLRPR